MTQTLPVVQASQRWRRCLLNSYTRSLPTSPVNRLPIVLRGKDKKYRMASSLERGNSQPARLASLALLNVFRASREPVHRRSLPDYLRLSRRLQDTDRSSRRLWVTTFVLANNCHFLGVGRCLEYLPTHFCG